MSRLNFRGHIGKRDYAVNTVAPTVSGSAISGQTLTGTNGTWTSSESLVTGYAYQWQTADAPDFSTWTELVGSTAITLVLAAGQISKKVRLGVSAINGDGQSAFVYTLPTAIVQDAPAIPLSISGSPVTNALQGASATFTVSFDGGTGSYTPSLINAPSGSTVTPIGAGDQATVSLSTANAGSFSGIIVRVSDGSSTADLASFTLTVTSSSGIPVVSPASPTSTFAGTTTTPAGPVGSSSNPGYNHSPTVRWGTTRFQDITGELVVWLYAFGVFSNTQWQANQKPTAGINYVDFQVNGGTVVRVSSPTYNSVDGIWGWPVKVRASDFADGVMRDLRATVVPKDGSPIVAQGTDIFMKAGSFFFHTNANGTLPSADYYIGGSGNDTTGNGTSGNPWRSVSKAIAALVAAQPNATTRGGDILMMGGSYNLSSAGATCNSRYIRLRAAPGVSPSDVVLNPGSSTDGAPGITRLALMDLTLNIRVYANTNSLQALWFKNVSFNGWDKQNAGCQPYNQPGTGFLNGVYVEDSTFNKARESLNGVTLARNNQITNNGWDIFSNSWGCVVNNTVAGVNYPPVGGVHPDLFQFYRSDAGIVRAGIYANITAVTNLECQWFFPDEQGNFTPTTGNVSGAWMIDNTIYINASFGRNMILLGMPTVACCLYNCHLDGNNLVYNYAQPGTDCISVISTYKNGGVSRSGPYPNYT